MKCQKPSTRDNKYIMYDPNKVSKAPIEISSANCHARAPIMSGGGQGGENWGSGWVERVQISPLEPDLSFHLISSPVDTPKG